MENILAMQIVGAITVLIGLRMNMDPVGFNKDIFGDVEGVDSGEMSASRLAIGGNNGSWSAKSILQYEFDEGTATETVLIGTVIGLATFFRYHCQRKVPRIYIRYPKTSNDCIANTDRNLVFIHMG